MRSSARSHCQGSEEVREADAAAAAEGHAGRPPVLLQLPRGRLEEGQRATRQTPRGRCSSATPRSPDVPRPSGPPAPSRRPGGVGMEEGHRPIPAETVCVRPDHAVAPQHDRVPRRTGASGRHRAQRARQPREPEGCRCVQQGARARPASRRPVLGLDHPFPARRPRHVVPVPRACLRPPRAVARQLAQARRSRIRARRAAQHHRRHALRPAPRPPDRPRDHDHRPVADGDSRVRHRDRPDPDLRDHAEVVAGVGNRARRGERRDADQVPAVTELRAGRRALRVHRPDHAFERDRVGRCRIHPHGVPEGLSPRRSSASTCCATRCCPRSPSSPPRSAT